MTNPNDYNNDCYFYAERREMGSSTPCCWLWDAIGVESDECLCNKRTNNRPCEFYIPKKAADAIMVAVAIDRHFEFDDSQQKPLS